MKDFKFLQDLPAVQPIANKIVAETTETEYLVYILTLEDAQLKIGVPIASIVEFDLFIAEHDVNAVKQNLDKFNAIEIE